MRRPATNARPATIVLTLLIASAVNSNSLVLGQAIAPNRVAVNRNRPFQIVQGNGPSGPRIIAYVNGASIIFEASNNADEAVDGDDATIDEQHRARPRITNANLNQWTFGIGSDVASAEMATGLLDIELQDELKFIDAACKLTPTQRKKLSLAGRGDIKRFVDRAARLRTSIENTDHILTEDQFREWGTPLGAECEQMRQLLLAGLFGPDSLFFKTQGTTLTREQLALILLAKLRDSDAGVPHRAPSASK